ncbi:MAG TPA: hypothetical protein VK929_11270 [Longimicrobiales bacterium]|nr:hypothetical protein [Longimicrobiales bacterium]
MYPESSEAPLTSVQQVLPLPDFSIAVVDAATEHVLLFGSDGNLRGSLGRRGSGPGEFRRIGRIGYFDGQVWVHDPLLRRLTTFSIESLEATGTFDSDELPAGIRQVLAFDGSVITAAVATTADLSDLALVWHGPRLSTEHARVPLRWDRNLVVSLPGAGEVTLMNPFSRGHVVASAGDTLVAVIAQPDPAADSGAVNARVFTGPGATEWAGSIAYTPRPVDRAVIDEWLSGLDVVDHLAGAGILTASAARERIRNALGDARHQPAVRNSGIGVTSTSAHVDVAGRVWLELDAEGWYVTERDAPTRRAHLPPGVTLHAVADEYAWGTIAGGFGIPSVVRFRVSRISDER